MRGLKPDALREHLSHRAGDDLTKYARVVLRRHHMELHKVCGKPQYFIDGGTGPPGKMYGPEELRGLLVEIRRGEMKGR